MNKLKLLSGAPNEIVMEREFAAPRRLVIRAMTTPELVKRWLGGVRTTVTVVEIDARVGGRYRYAFRNPDGSEFAFTGEYRELSDEHVVYTQHFNGDPDGATISTTYSEVNGRTTMRVTMAFSSSGLRDMVLGTGMADGAGESYDELDKLLASL